MITGLLISMICDGRLIGIVNAIDSSRSTSMVSLEHCVIGTFIQFVQQ